ARSPAGCETAPGRPAARYFFSRCGKTPQSGDIPVLSADALLRSRGGLCGSVRELLQTGCSAQRGGTSEWPSVPADQFSGPPQLWHEAEAPYADRAAVA